MILAIRNTLDGLRRPLLAGFDQSWKRNLFALAFGIVLFLYPFGLLFVAGGVLPEPYSWTASVVILFNALAALFSEMRAASTSRVLSTAAVLTILLYCIELFGVSTGLPFGAYSYTDVLGFRLLGVPVAISLAWYTTIVLSWRIAEGLVGPGHRAWRVAVSLGAALLTLALDLALEPMAAEIKGYWAWVGGTVPPQNYLSWLGVSMVVVFVLAGREGGLRPQRGRLFACAAILYGMQFVLFSLTAIIHGKLVPVVSALGVIAGVVIGARSTRRLEDLSRSRTE